jgi:hypothetical protein
LGRKRAFVDVGLVDASLGASQQAIEDFKITAQPVTHSKVLNCGMQLESARSDNAKMPEIFTSPVDVHIIAALEASKKTHSRQAMRSAIDHLRRAETLFPIDLEMAVFRCITAVEEAASSLMLLMQEKGYPRANELKRTNHLFKNAMLPFLRIFYQRVLRASHQKFDIDLIVHRHLQQALGVVVIAHHDDGSRSEVPINPPLSLLFSDDGLGIDKELDIDAFIKREGAASVSEYLKLEANFRNKLLYASPAGIPRIQIDQEKFFPAKQQAVRTMLCAYLLMEPFGPQPTATYALSAFLDLIAYVKV